MQAGALDHASGNETGRSTTVGIEPDVDAGSDRVVVQVRGAEVTDAMEIEQPAEVEPGLGRERTIRAGADVLPFDQHLERDRRIEMIDRVGGGIVTG